MDVVIEILMYLCRFLGNLICYLLYNNYIEGEVVSEEENLGDEEDFDVFYKEVDIENIKVGKRKRKI